MDGCVFYKANLMPCFEVDTAIEPENVFAIPYEKLVRYHSRKELETMHVLGGQIKEDMERAIQSCEQIEQARKEKLLKLLNGEAI